jgi:hypothetical protein
MWALHFSTLHFFFLDQKKNIAFSNAKKSTPKINGYTKAQFLHCGITQTQNHSILNLLSPELAKFILKVTYNQNLNQINF